MRIVESLFIEEFAHPLCDGSIRRAAQGLALYREGGISEGIECYELRPICRLAIEDIHTRVLLGFTGVLEGGHIFVELTEEGIEKPGMTPFILCHRSTGDPCLECWGAEEPLAIPLPKDRLTVGAAEAR